MERLLVLLAVLAVTGLLAAWWRARDGRVISTLTVIADEHGFPREAVELAMAVAPRTALVLVEFTAPDCVPCVRTKVILDEAAADRPDLSVVTLDVADALDLARAHRIMRAPTTLLITAEGHLLGRVSGIPRAKQLAALLHDDGRATAA